MTDTKQNHTYTFGYGRNSYFQGSDGHVERGDGKSIAINQYDGMMAVNIKDHAFDIIKNLSPELQAKAAQLNDTGQYETEYSDEFEDWLIEDLREQWWRDAHWMVEEDPGRPDWATNVFSAGRSGGWCCIDGSQPLVDNFPTHSETEQCEVCGEGSHRHDKDTDHAFEPDSMVIMRDEFLELAFNLVGMIDYLKTEHAIEIINGEYSDLEYRREANTIRGEE